MNYPIDCLLFIGKKSLNFRKHFIITNEKNVIDLRECPSKKSVHRGKWLVKPDKMATPFDHKIQENENRIMNQSWDKMTITTKEIYEIHGKDYLGHPIAAEIWDKNLKPIFFVMNKYQKEDLLFKIIKS